MTDYSEKIAKIERVTLGWEDHGIFTCMLHLNYGHSGQGAGGYCLDEPLRGGDDKFIRRVGTAAGMEFIVRVMRAVGVGDWSELEGKTILALGVTHTKVAGIAPLPTERGERFIFQEWADEFYPEEVVVVGG